MRQSLINSFDEIYVLDLHGDLQRKESLENGMNDENVFDIRKGVAIILCVKKAKRNPKASIHYAEIKDSRENKYAFLRSHDIKSTHWKELDPESPKYFFIPKRVDYRTEYELGLSLSAIFPTYSSGVKTHRDNLVIDFERRTLELRIRQLRNSSLDDAFISQAYDLKDTRGWSLRNARSVINAASNWQDAFLQIQYRPFDFREIFYHDALVERSRREIMRHMFEDNLLLCCSRQVLNEYRHAFVSRLIVNYNIIDTAGRFGSGYVFPLYLYPDADKKDLFSQHRPSERVPNIAPKLIEALKSAFKKEPSPEQIFHYIYALLYSNAYRKKYAEFLKTDFPRVPFTKDYNLFNKLAEKGEELVELHLLKSKKLVKPIARCEGSGDLRVDKVTYDQNNARVHINPEKWFSGIPPEVWEYHIGGYQVSEKWLKDRKGKGLSSEEVAHYARVVTAIAETISIQRPLDDLFAEVETSLLEVRL
jgi:predicted helicase